MDKSYWIDLFTTMLVEECPPSMRLQKPTSEAISAFEEALDFKLPRDYIHYIQVFGPGELAWEYRLKAPGYPEQGDRVDLLLFNQDL